MTLLESAIWYNQNWRVNVVFAYFKKVLNKWKDLLYSSLKPSNILDLYREAKSIEKRVNSISAVISDYLCEVLDGKQYVVIDIDTPLTPWQKEVVSDLAKKTVVMVTVRGYSIWFKMACEDAPKKTGKICKADGTPIDVELICKDHCAVLVPSARMRDDGTVHIVHFHPNSTKCREGDVHCLRDPRNLVVEPAMITFDELQALVSDLFGGMIPEDIVKGSPRVRIASASASLGGARVPTLPMNITFDEFISGLESACRDGYAPRCLCWAFFEFHREGERWIAFALATLAFTFSCINSGREWDRFIEFMSEKLENFPYDRGTTLDRKMLYLVSPSTIGEYLAPRYTSISFIPIPYNLCMECPYRDRCNRRSFPLRITPYIIARALNLHILDELGVRI